MAFFHWTSGLALVACSGVCGAQSLTYLLGPGGNSGDRLGWSVADVADLDGDGHPDVLVGAPLEDANGHDSGAVRAYSGKTGALIRTWVGEAADDDFGWSVDGVDDFDGDGRGDVIVGAPLHDFSAAKLNSGKVYVYSGKTGALKVTFQYAQYGAQLGTTVHGLRDLDGDGAGDFGFGAPYFDDELAGHDNTGRLDVKSGATFNSLGVALGSASNDLFGYDFDLVEVGATTATTWLIVGAPGAATTGAATLVSATGVKLTTVHGLYVDGFFGSSVATLGDVDGDGLIDIAIGEPYADWPATDAGRMLVFRESGALLMATYILPGAVAGERFGEELAGIGDFDGDGHDDVLIGTPVSDEGGTNSGKAVVVSVQTAAKIGIWSGGSGDSFGRSVSSAGDLNLDGVNDLIVGAPFTSNGAGLASVMLARAPQPSKYCVAKSNSLGCVPAIGYGGIPSLSIADGFHVTATNVLNKKNGIVFWGHASTSLPFHDATLCVKAPVVRSPVLSSGGSLAGSDCTGNYTFVFSHAYMQTKNLVAGETFYAQVWSRDPAFAPPFNFGMTDALSFEVVP